MPSATRPAPLPNAFLLGAAKAGTTSLAAAIAELDDCFVPVEKETHYFDSDDGYAQGLAWYQKFFADAGDARWIWDCTPNYFHRGRIVIPRMQETFDSETLEELRFVVVLRDPVQRAFSHYLHQVRVGIERRSFRDVVVDEEPRDGWSQYVADSEYGRQLTDWFEAFDRDQFIVIIAEDHPDYDAILSTIAQHFGSSPSVSVPRLNEHGEPRSGRLMDFLAHPPAPISAVTQRFVPLRLRRSIRVRLRALNLRPASRPLVDDNAAADLRRHLASDRELLAELLGRDLPW